MPKHYAPEFREHAVRMVTDKVAAEGCSQRSALLAVATSLGISDQTLRGWTRSPRVTSATAAPPRESLEEENRRLRRELAETRRANEILKKASAFFAAELDRPTTR
ncbi:transposase [Dermacoccus barathri]|uniref:Transposase n=1 Tax=Dermacoccus barathri TaxID=322601 RepID=A0ABN2C1R2_9MICO